MTSGGGDTIAAIASPAGPGLRGVVRISGAGAWSLVEAVWRGEDGPPDRGRRGSCRGRFADGVGELPGVLLWMPGPRSFTREDVAELHLPGSPPLLRGALDRVLSLGARAARAGEFTRRAFENGRIDLTRAEGVLAVVRARTEREARSARALLLGGLGTRIERLREDLEVSRALCEASLDFEEDDTGHIGAEELAGRAEVVLAGLREAEGWEARRVPPGGLPRVVLGGPPNAGKSSLFNALGERSEALVSEVAGTTRDVLTATWRLPGGAVQLVDTAGLERASGGPDEEAQRRGRDLRQVADLLLWVLDAGEAGGAERIEPAVREAGGAPVLVAWNKTDRPGASPIPALPPGVRGAVTSATERSGLEDLAREAAASLSLGGASPAPPRGGLERELSARHRAALRAAAGALEQGILAVRAGTPLDLFAEQLRVATAELDAIGGRTTPEDLLDRIFGAFCIGK